LQTFGCCLWPWRISSHLEGTHVHLSCASCSNQREDWLRDYVGEIAPDLRHFLPRGTLVDGESFIFFRRRLDRSIDQAEILAQASRSLEPGGCIRPPDNRRFLAFGFSSGGIFATAPSEPRARSVRRLSRTMRWSADTGFGYAAPPPQMI
jgi:hypothetical protein